MADGQDTDGIARQSTWAELSKSAVQALIPVVVTAGSLVGFVAFAGSVIVWTRFSAAKVPADQVVNAVPRGELVAIGSSLLLLFGFFGALAMITVYLIDRGGRATPGMSRGLLLLLLAEGMTAILAIPGGPELRRILAAELFVLPVGISLWATEVGPFIRLEDEVPDRKSEELDPVSEERPFRTSDGHFPSFAPLVVIFAMVAMAYAPLLAAGATLALGGSALLAAVVGVGALLACLAVLVLVQHARFHRDPSRRREAEEAKESRKREAETRDRERDAVVRGLSWAGVDLTAAEDEEPRRKPYRLRLSPDGTVLMAAALVAAVAGPSLVLGAWWMLAALASAVVLTAALWRIAELASARFMWYGFAVFISVPLFGTLMLMAHNIDDPQVQPMALIRNTDGPDEAIQGLFVTETDDRVYFATVATEGCSNRLAPHSGRLLWVPRSELVAMSIGPLQDVSDAGDTALEMAYTLTPNVENPGGGEAGLTVAHREESTIAQKGAATIAHSDVSTIAHGQPQGSPPSSGPALDKRLENVGAAVRPNFGAGWSLTPEDATPGEVVTLRMSAPNGRKGVEGFGSVREGRTLRIGGERVAVLKERARSPWDAEYVETVGGRTLKLEKQTVYESPASGRFNKVDDADQVKDDGHGAAEELYVRLADKSLRDVANGSGPGGLYLPLEEQHPRLAESGLVAVLKNGHEAPLEGKLLRQAWHSDHIRFRVPEDARSGPVTVECAQLAGQPLLRVSHPPAARIAIHMHAGSERVTLDSTPSGDEDGRLASQHWSVDGIRRGSDGTISVNMRPRKAAYSIRLAVTDSQGQVDTVEARILRLPPGQLRSLSAGGASASTSSSEEGTPPALEQSEASLAKAVEKEPSAQIEVDAHQALSAETPRQNLQQSLDVADVIDRRMLSSSQPPGLPAGGIPLKKYAYGESCPPPWHTAERVRVDIFVLGEGASVVPPHDCHPGRLHTGRW